MIWPIALIVLSNVSIIFVLKETPSAIDPFASLTVTYKSGFVFWCYIYNQQRPVTLYRNIKNQLERLCLGISDCRP